MTNSGLVFTREYRRVIKISDAFRKHIWEEGIHKMYCSFDRDSGTGHIYCVTCHKVVWESDE